MASNPYQHQPKARLRTLARLERKLDRSNDHVREYYNDRADIHALVQAGDIDRAHGELLMEAAEKRYALGKERKAKQRKDEQDIIRQRDAEDTVRPYVYAVIAALLVWLFFF